VIHRLLLILALLAAWPAHAAPSSPFHAAAPQSPAGAEQNVPITTRTLPNGLLVAVVENHSVPLVTIEVAVHSGSMNEPPNFSGLSHLYEHMFFKGNAVIPNQEAYLKRLRQLGAMWNGTTSQERVNYFFTMGSANLDAGMAFMRDALVTPRFEPQELARERQVVIGEIDRNEAEPLYHLSRALDQKLWHRFPSYKDPLGTRDSVNKATVEQMRFFRETYYVPNNSLLVIAGDTTPEKAFAAAEKYFSAWRRGPDPFQKHPLVAHPVLQKSAATLVRQPVQNGRLSLSWQGPSTANDLKAAMIADVFSFAVNQDGTRLQKALVDSGLATRARLSYATLRNTGQIWLEIEGPPEKLTQAAAVALREAAHFGEVNYLTEEEWRNAKTLLSVQDRYDRERMSEYSHVLSFWWAVAGLDAYQDYIPTVQSSTRSNGADYASRYMVGKPLVLGALLSDADTKKLGVSEATLNALLRKEWTATPAVRVAGAQQAAAAVTVPEVESFTVDGIPVLLRNNPAAPVVGVSLYFRGGSTNLTADTQGIEQLALESALYGGTGSLSRQQFHALLNSMGTRLDIGANADYSRVDMQCVGEFFDPSWHALAEAITNPAFRPADVELMRRGRLSAIRREHESADDSVRRLAELLYFRTHPYALRPIGTEDALKKLTRDQVAAYYQALATRSRMLLVVVGDLDRARVEAAVRGSLGKLPAGSWRAPSVPAVAHAKSAVQVTERKLPTNYVRGMFAAPPPDSPNHAAALLALDVLSDRFFEEILTKRNLSYSTWASISSRRSNYGLLYVTTTKPNEVVAIMKKEAARLATTPLSTDELQEQINTFITRYYLDMETSAAQAERIGHAQVVAGDWRKAFSVVSEVQALTPQALRQAAGGLVRNVQWAVLGDPRAIDPNVFMGE